MRLNHALVQKIPDGLRLKLLDDLIGPRVEDAHERTQFRLNIHRAVRDHAEEGKVAFVTSGMDCDCCRWENRVHLMPASIKQVLADVDAEYADPEGASDIRIMRPSEAAKLKESHRDLVMEAYENGHQYRVVI